MDNITQSPPIHGIGLSIDEDRLQSSGPWGAIPDGLIAWISGTEKLTREHHGFVVTDISYVEAYWSFVELGFSSAGFVVKTHDGRRFHLQCAIDEDNQPDIVAVSAEEVPEGQTLPKFGKCIEALGGWSREVDSFNIDLARLKTSNAA